MLLRVRTTLTLEDDLAAALKERARTLGLSFKQVVNQTIRQGLGQPSAGPGDPPIRAEMAQSAADLNGNAHFGS